MTERYIPEITHVGPGPIYPKLARSSWMAPGEDALKKRFAAAMIESYAAQNPNEPAWVFILDMLRGG